MKLFPKFDAVERFRELIKKTRFIERLKEFQSMVSTAIIISVGAFLFLLGGWILLMQIAGWFDFYQPNSIKIGAISIDTKESKSHAELFRARFDHHFRPYEAVPLEKGFLEVQALDIPRFFQQPQNESKFSNVSVEVSGVDVGILYQLINRIAQPAQWIVEGDFQTMPDRMLLALRMRRGERLIRTWYLEQYGKVDENKSVLIERLIDDAIFQLAYDFTNKNEVNEDIAKWRSVLPEFKVSFPDRQAFSAYFVGRSALARYFSAGDWKELDKAIVQLRLLRALMPENKEGLQLLALALAENRNDSEAIHVYDQLLSLLEKSEKSGNEDEQSLLEKWATQLHKATAMLQLFAWRSTHQAHDDLIALRAALNNSIEDRCKNNSDQDFTLYCVKVYELQAQTNIQLAYSYGIYLAYLKDKMVSEIFGSDSAPNKLRIKDKHQLDVLRNGLPEDGGEAKEIVKAVMVECAAQHIARLNEAQENVKLFTDNWQRMRIEQGSRRVKELQARYHFVAGYTHFRIAQLESSVKGATIIINESILEQPDLQADDTAYGARTRNATEHLKQAEAAHPNHYQVLQFLGLVLSEPRLKNPDLHIAEQYFERAILAKPTAYYSRALRAELLLRRISDLGLQSNGLELIEYGLKDVRKALEFKPTSNTTNILFSKYLLLQLEVESEPEKRKELRQELDVAIEKAERYTPRLFKQVSIELDWINIVASAGRLKEQIANLKSGTPHDIEHDQSILTELAKQKKRLLQQIAELTNQAKVLEARWVAHQHIFQVDGLKERAEKLRESLEDRETIQDWAEFNIELFDSLGRAAARS